MFIKEVTITPKGFRSWVSHDIYTVYYKFQQWNEPVLENSRLFVYHVNPEDLARLINTFRDCNTAMFLAEVEDPKVIGRQEYSYNTVNYPVVWNRYMSLKDFDPAEFPCFITPVVCTKVKLVEMIDCDPNFIRMAKSFMEGE